MKKLIAIIGLVSVCFAANAQFPNFPDNFTAVKLQGITNLTCVALTTNTSATTDLSAYDGKVSVLLFLTQSGDAGDTNTVSLLASATNGGAATVFTNFTPVVAVANGAGSYQKIDLDIGSKDRFWKVQQVIPSTDDGTSMWHSGVIFIGGKQYK